MAEELHAAGPGAHDQVHGRPPSPGTQTSTPRALVLRRLPGGSNYVGAQDF